jgi:DNA (cytosine-5)-methyltransferase 1
MDKLRAIDLYSGIGGWTLGFKMANVEIVQSYEWWDKANKTHNLNLNTSNLEVNIRELKLNDLPQNIDVVVGSPPCTEFSFSNKGGSGDIDEGLKDVLKFLEVVHYLKPKYWIMENVPRIAKILETELEYGGKLHRFRNLFNVISVVNMSEYGLPQRRKRTIAGKFPYTLFEGYKVLCQKRTLGQVIKSLNHNPALDPLYGISLERSLLTDTETESFLNHEEERMNREAKEYHPVYNVMSFPDKLNEPSRTITATCTRISRESIIVDNSLSRNRFRRITIRERASLQGFPITFQFYGASYSQKMKMVGNAIPPFFTYYLAQAILETPPNKLKHPYEIGYDFKIPKIKPPITKLDSEGTIYPINRKFRAAIPHLRFGSGLRFELVNSHRSEFSWRIDFYYGSSKAYKTLDLDNDMLVLIKGLSVYKKIRSVFRDATKKLDGILSNISSDDIQMTWTHKKTIFHPYDLIDAIGQISQDILEHFPGGYEKDINDIVLKSTGQISMESMLILAANNGGKKLVRNAKSIFTGMLVGSWFNSKCLLQKR